VSRGLEDEMLNMASRIDADNGITDKNRKILYAIAEVERPDMRANSPLRKELSEEDLFLRNVVRPGYHDNVTIRQPTKLPNGEPFIYDLPIMATAAERKEAQEAGKPLEPEPLMFCIKPIGAEDKKGIMSGELKRLITWFYVGYLVEECSDVKKKEATELLNKALATLPKGDNVWLPFMKVSETALKD
jgi:hypothetical protein